jgi:putative SOS response-associated peptidase YedK
MCGRYLVITEDEIIEMRSILEELNQRFSDADAFSIKSAGTSAVEVVPSLVTPVLVAQGDQCVMRPMKWGFPRWDGSGSVINARSENVSEKPFFREAFLHNRCIIPSRGFFEWKKPSSAPLLELAALSQDDLSPGKYWIRRADSPLFFMAGIFQRSQGFEEFVILTMPANIRIAPVHDRMPVFLEKPQLLPWLSDPGVLKTLVDNQASDVPFVLSRADRGERNIR